MAYPLLAHAATITASHRLTLASVAALALSMLLPGLLMRRLMAWMGALVAAAVVVLLAGFDEASVVLFLPPVLITLFLAWLFGRTLGRGQPSLIERLVRLLHPPDEPVDPAIVRYAAVLTAVWTGLFLVMASGNLLLALLATPGGLLELAGLAPAMTVSIETWSLFANLLNYLVVGVFFLGEWLYRRHRFPDQSYRSLLDFICRMAAVGPVLLADVGRGHRNPPTP